MTWEPIETMPVDICDLIYYMIKTVDPRNGKDIPATWVFARKIQEEDEGEYIDKYYYMTKDGHIWPYIPTHWLKP